MSIYIYIYIHILIYVYMYNTYGTVPVPNLLEPCSATDVQLPRQIRGQYSHWSIRAFVHDGIG